MKTVYEYRCDHDLPGWWGEPTDCSFCEHVVDPEDAYVIDLDTVCWYCIAEGRHQE